jgi:hypothetical protein
LEQRDEIEKAYEAYLGSEKMLRALEITTEEPAFVEQQRVLAYCLMRQSNILRQKGKSEEALALSEREMTAARASKDEIALARSLMSNGTNYTVAGEAGKGLVLLDEAREIFSGGESYDHQQGLGWFWILQADLANAGLIEREPEQVLDFADRALAILEPIKNWPGVARAYAVRVEIHKRLGNEEEAALDQEKEKHYKSKIEGELS